MVLTCFYKEKLRYHPIIKYIDVHTGAAEQGEQGEQLLPQIYQWGSSTPPTFHRHYFVYTEQPKCIIYACCEELTVNAKLNLLQSESAQSRQQSFWLHEQPL